MGSENDPSQPSVAEIKLTLKQQEAESLLKHGQRHTLLVGGSRSGKTTLLVKTIADRAVKTDRSRHAILRFRANAGRASIALDTLPKVFRIWHPAEVLKRHRTERYFSLDNEAQKSIGALDGQERE